MAATATDKIVLRICALCLQGAQKEAYVSLLQSIPDAELQALMVVLNETDLSLTELADKVFERDWMPLLRERQHLLADVALFQELNLLTT